MRPAIEVATQICGCADARQRKADIAVIEADRLAVVAAIVAELRELALSFNAEDCAEYIEAKFGGGNNGDR